MSLYEGINMNSDSIETKYDEVMQSNSYKKCMKKK